MEEGFSRAALRLFRPQLRRHRTSWWNSVAVWGERYGCEDDSSVFRRSIPNGRWEGPVDLRRVGTFSRAAERGFPLRAQHWTHRGTLAHSNENGESADP